MARVRQARKCKGHKTNGEPCGAYAINGGMVCATHGGKTPKVKAKAAIRAELTHWGLGDTDVDPGETLLRLLTQTISRAERYAAEVQRIVDEQGLQEALVGESYVMDDKGNLKKVGEYVRGLASLENAERDRAAKYSSLALQAGIAERQVRLAERQTEIVEKALAATLDDLGLPEAQRQQAYGRLAHHLRLTA